MWPSSSGDETQTTGSDDGNLRVSAPPKELASLSNSVGLFHGQMRRGPRHRKRYSSTCTSAQQLKLAFASTLQMNHDPGALTCTSVSLLPVSSRILSIYEALWLLLDTTTAIAAAGSFGNNHTIVAETPTRKSNDVEEALPP